MDDTVISIEHLSKQYRLGTISHGVFVKDLQSWWARVRGKEDPNSIISAPQHSGLPNESDYFWALQDVSFEVKRGEAIGIIGRNGAGKSTLLKILSRVTAPTKGVSKIRGRVASLLEVGTGFHQELTGRENIYLNGAILGMTKKEIDRKFGEILDFAEIQRFIDTPVKRYSSGMYVRLAFAVAAHLEPEILIIDEVLAVGDAQFQKKCLGKMEGVTKGEGKTILFVSHNMGAINNLCTSAVLLEKGCLRSIGPTKEIIDLYLEETHRHLAEKEFPINPHLKVQVVSARLFDDRGKEACEFHCGSDVTVEYTYVINTPVSGCHAACYLTTLDGYHLFSTADTDTAPERFSTRQVGMYRARFNIPTAILNTGTYNLGFSFGIPGVEVFDRQEALSFSIVDTGAFGTMKDGDRRAGIMLCEVSWHYEQIGV